MYLRIILAATIFSHPTMTVLCNLSDSPSSNLSPRDDDGWADDAVSNVCNKAIEECFGSDINILSTEWDAEDDKEENVESEMDHSRLGWHKIPSSACLPITCL